MFQPPSLTFRSLACSHWDAESLEGLFVWLERNGLTAPGGCYDAHPSPDGTEILSPETSVLGLPCQRDEKRKRDELDHLRERFGQVFAGPTLLHDREQIWKEIGSKGKAVRDLDLKLLPADAMAFYRQFHCPPFGQWGIYIIIPRLLRYHEYLKQRFCSIKIFTPETSAVCVLFEIFHHEFFHHLVETTATTLEVLSAAAGDPRPFYLEYRRRVYEQNLGIHRHTPLEEALANAYAYNAFSFMSRVKVGYVHAMASLYQEAIRAYWPTQPEGYRYAGEYAKSGYVRGAAQLLAMIMGRALPESDEPLLTIARAVFPSGHTAFFTKPEIPTYLVGTDEELAKLRKLVPAPNESYTSLFWPGETSKLDEFIQQKKNEERRARKADRVTR